MSRPMASDFDFMMQNSSGSLSSEDSDILANDTETGTYKYWLDDLRIVESPEYEHPISNNGDFSGESLASEPWPDTPCVGDVGGSGVDKTRLAVLDGGTEANDDGTIRHGVDVDEPESWPFIAHESDAEKEGEKVKNNLDEIDIERNGLKSNSSYEDIDDDLTADDYNKARHDVKNLTSHDSLHGKEGNLFEIEEEDEDEDEPSIQWKYTLEKTGIRSVHMDPKVSKRPGKGRVRTLSLISEGSHTSLEQHSPSITRADRNEGHLLSDSDSEHTDSEQSSSTSESDDINDSNTSSNGHVVGRKQPSLEIQSKDRIADKRDGKDDNSMSEYDHGPNKSFENEASTRGVGHIVNAKTESNLGITNNSSIANSTIANNHDGSSHLNTTSKNVVTTLPVGAPSSPLVPIKRDVVNVPFEWPCTNTELESSPPKAALPHSFSQPVISLTRLTQQVEHGKDQDSSVKRPLPARVVGQVAVSEGGSTHQEDMDNVPDSLKNLTFLLHPSQASRNGGNGTSGASGPSRDQYSGSDNSLNNSFRKDVKRSSMKKRPYPASTAGTGSGTDVSLSTAGNKKSIKWHTDFQEAPPVNSTTPASKDPRPFDPSRLQEPSGPKATVKSSIPIRDDIAGNLSFSTKQPGASGMGTKEGKFLNEDTTQNTGDSALGKKDINFPGKDGVRNGKGNEDSDTGTFTSVGGGSSYKDSSYKDDAGTSNGGNPLNSSSSGNNNSNIIARVIKNLKRKTEQPRSSIEEVEFEETDDDLMSLSAASSVGGLSMTVPERETSPRPLMYLTDVEDNGDHTVRKNGMASNEANAREDSIVSDDVFKPTSLLLRRGHNSKDEGFLPEVLKNSLVIILSGIYGIVLVVLGLVLPISETFADPQKPFFFEIFYLYLYAVSMVFLVYVYTYLLRREQLFKLTFTKTLSRTLSRTFSRTSQRSRHNSDKASYAAGKPPLSRASSNISTTSLRSSRSRKRKIAFNPDTSNHTGSFYLRVGVIGFGIGSMIHSGLIFGHYFEINHLRNHCSNIVQAIKPFTHLIFTFVQMYFVFMNSKMCVHKYKTLARFGLMHMSATNICVWLRAIVVETLHVIKSDQRRVYESLIDEYKKTMNGTPGAGNHTSGLENYMADQDIGYLPELNCHWTGMMGQLVEKSSTYLYPCTIEYSLVCACVLYVMWSNVGEGSTKRRREESCSDSIASTSDGDDDNGTKRMSVDCAASSKGLFLGIMLFVGSVVCLVCFYVLISKSKHMHTGRLVGHLSEDVTYVLAFIATIVAAYQMREMHFSNSKEAGLEEILSLISLSGLGLYGAFSIVAAVFYLDTSDGAWTIITNIFMLIQAGAQATFTLAALRASAVNGEQLRSKPGRQCVTFLLISNFALWAINTFETQRLEHNSVQVDFYGSTAWSIFSHISVPLGIYFRFHSTVNLSIIWKKAWKMKHTVLSASEY